MPVPFVSIAIPVAAALGAGALGYVVGRADSESAPTAIDYDDFEDNEEGSPGGAFGIHSETGEDAGSRWTDMSRADALEILELAPDATPEDIREAHRRILRRVQPEGGELGFLAAAVDRARDRLLD
ncbi:MAG: hypothetical protein OXI95_09315 [bacterium]|nr:hypothetical protein [bacterium]